MGSQTGTESRWLTPRLEWRILVSLLLIFRVLLQLVTTGIQRTGLLSNLWRHTWWDRTQSRDNGCCATCVRVLQHPHNLWSAHWEQVQSMPLISVHSPRLRLSRCKREFAFKESLRGVSGNTFVVRNVMPCMMLTKKIQTSGTMWWRAYTKFPLHFAWRVFTLIQWIMLQLGMTLLNKKGTRRWKTCEEAEAKQTCQANQKMMTTTRRRRTRMMMRTKMRMRTRTLKQTTI